MFKLNIATIRLVRCYPLDNYFIFSKNVSFVFGIKRKMYKLFYSNHTYKHIILLLISLDIVSH